MYMEELKGLGDSLTGKCPLEMSREDMTLILVALDNRLNYTAKRRINTVTDVVFLRRHPERVDTKNMTFIPLPSMQTSKPEEQMLIVEWLFIRNCLVMPAHRVWLKLKKNSK